MKKALLILIALFSISATGFSQTGYRYGLPRGKDFDRWSIGLIGGISNFQSDLKPKGEPVNSLKSFKASPVYGGNIGYQLSHSIGFSLQGLWGNFEVNPSKVVFLSKPIDSAAFVKYSSPLAEYSASMIFSFGNISFIKRNSNIHFVLKAGVGLSQMKPDLKYSRDSALNYIQFNNPVNVTNVVVPFGLGVRYAFGKFNIGIDYDYRKAFTDKLDALSIPNSDYDGYTTLTGQLKYIIGKKKKPMEWVNPMELIYNDIDDMKGRVDSLTTDKDRDGVADIFDRDNTTPAGSKVYGDGTIIDTDGDGLADGVDADPYSTHGAKVDGSGKEVDTDNDGVPDSRDKDNETPSGAMVNFQGLTINKGGTGDNISNVNVTNNNGGVGFFPSVFFDVNKADIKAIYYDRFLTIARVMKMNPDLVVKIIGSADQQGNVELNNKLGMKRAESAKSHLVKVYDIDPARLLTDSKGKNEPLASKASQVTDYLNRRVDFIIEAGTIKK